MAERTGKAKTRRSGPWYRDGTILGALIGAFAAIAVAIIGLHPWSGSPESQGSTPTTRSTGSGDNGLPVASIISFAAKETRQAALIDVSGTVSGLGPDRLLYAVAQRGDCSMQTSGSCLWTPSPVI